MSRVPPEDWRPRGIPNLEPEAWRALRRAGSTSVVAGPGAGKTEFLAQRAVYLLETGTCPPPFRILAISFKSDAATNLADRVRQRCPPELARRFVSLTFDAFTKGLVDRFLGAVPADWQPTRPYEIAFSNWRQTEQFLAEARLNAAHPWQAEVAGYPAGTFESERVGSYRLPLTRLAPQSALDFTVDRWWQQQLRGGATSAISFVSINRLAELLLRANPHICRALRATYPFVFVDEFQDTTYAQYDFLLSAFSGGATAVTAVGDDKQRIMVWAGARPDAFRRFEQDFEATRIALTFNFRSSPDLVRIQHIVAQALDEETVPTIAQTERAVDGDVAQVWNSPTRAVEAEHLAAWLSEDMRIRGRVPRDYALLVRQKADEFENDLAESFRAAGLHLRNESHALGRTTLQDLLADNLCRLAVGVLRLGATRRAPDSWQLVSSAVAALRGVDPDDETASHKAETSLAVFLADVRAEMGGTVPTAANAGALADRVLDYLDLVAVSRTYLEYGTGDLLSIMAEAFRLHLIASSAGAPSWSECLDAFEGVGRIPLMTVHKSKGLEYDTIVFVGLDDQAWWAHAPGNLEGLATFFVALSRAKQRAIFSFCQQRGDRRKVAELYQLLTDAGVPEIAI
ncbi:MAG: ATP-dependent helicase [Planctomycetota bacterium]|nr:ATP-dependent helicase [Planctomycetota bacterium]